VACRAGPKIISKEKPRSSRGWSKRRGLAYLASGRLVLAGARSNRRPRFGLYRFGPITSADCCERRKCVAAIFAVRDAPAHDEPRSGPNNSEREPTSGRSTKYASAHLIRVFRDIGRISSLLFLLSHPSSRWSPAETAGSKAEDAIWFRRRRKWFQLCFVGNSSRVPPKRDPAPSGPEAQRAGSREPLRRAPSRFYVGLRRENSRLGARVPHGTPALSSTISAASAIAATQCAPAQDPP
jgi:hypothetical protein